MQNTWFKCGKIPQNAEGLAGIGSSREVGQKDPRCFTIMSSQRKLSIYILLATLILIWWNWGEWVVVLSPAYTRAINRTNWLAEVSWSQRLGPTTLHTRNDLKRQIQHDRHHMATLSWRQSVKLLQPPHEWIWPVTWPSHMVVCRGAVIGLQTADRNQQNWL